MESEWVCKLNQELSRELVEILQIIEVDHKSTLDDVLSDSKDVTKRGYLRKLCEQDKRERTEFWKDQTRNGEIEDGLVSYIQEC